MFSKAVVPSIQTFPAGQQYVSNSSVHGNKISDSLNYLKSLETTFFESACMPSFQDRFLSMFSPRTLL